ncbi:MAG TPA: hypothetical protein PLJ60_09010 [Chryseolinea sp.]|nr:hypothetical protein [Chryseolinea sp.]HPM30465.1 hypothetical protein [Chryseolinea sp.]
MVIRHLLGCVLLSGLFLTACNTNPKDKKKNGAADSLNNVVKTTYADGKPKVEIPYKNGKKNGQAKEFYQNGNVFQLIDYVNGKKHGFARRYYETGLIYQETPYDSNKIHGVQKKYRADGKLSAEIPYSFGNACAGIKEYTLDGSLKKNYPSIVIRPVDNILSRGEYKLVLTMSEKVKEVTYYEGKLTDGKCIGDKTEEICCADRSGEADISFFLPPGQFIMKEINIIAKVKTVQGNYYLTQRNYNVAIENRY